MSTLIVLDGLDGCGKTTQVDLLKSCFKDGLFLSYPKYSSYTGSLITEYLNGKRVLSADTVQHLYGVDRWLDYLDTWSNTTAEYIIAARYTTSTMIYLCAGKDKSEWDTLIENTKKFEYDVLGLPRPDKVIYLMLPLEVQRKLLNARAEETGVPLDKHESDFDFMHRCFEAATYLAEKEGWVLINCATAEGTMRTREDIHSEILQHISECKPTK